jgi:non-canonical (house-cleaning) NTP pyrophosphatase
MKTNTYVPLNGHIPNAVVEEVLQDLKGGKTYRQIVEDYAVSLGWISKVKRGQIRRNQ